MLSISDISVRLAGRLLIDQATVQITPGARVGMVGRNGTGKSTLFRAIRGELATESGTIAIPPRAAAILSGLGFSTADQARPVQEFSGGWRMRVALAATLFAAPDLLLLDEPTNYLDLEGTLWLEDHLAHYPRTVIVISHDRDLLESSVDQILHLERGKLTLYRGSYSSFDEPRAARELRDAKQVKRQEAERARLQAFVDRFKAKASKARQAQSRVKMLERLKPITPPVSADG